MEKWGERLKFCQNTQVQLKVGGAKHGSAPSSCTASGECLQECLKVKERDESERAAVCQSSQMAADTATRALRPDKGRGGMGVGVGGPISPV